MKLLSFIFAAFLSTLVAAHPTTNAGGAAILAKNTTNASHIVAPVANVDRRDTIHEIDETMKAEEEKNQKNMDYAAERVSSETRPFRRAAARSPACRKAYRFLFTTWTIYIPQGSDSNEEQCGKRYKDALKKHLMTGWECFEVDGRGSIRLHFHTPITTSGRTMEQLIQDVSHGAVSSIQCQEGDESSAESQWRQN